ncbi:hypothetical protein [Hyphomonas johnsonii]|uniref:Uncharacterized protein n=1 Tax=Hyphomonas johnsonii MHS-2 TaxID=1280950 RepID=A0A059FN49_9PROT|nr:hypothetical protein [Hyphomonas johnsonii]KCZ92095.1 hypothetical protein HJO_08674 [Hyphomonas johnsonii MHS-2]
METVIKTLFHFGPLVFAFGFIAPLTAQIIERAGLALPFGLTPLVAGLLLGAVWGGIAQYRGRWI